VSVTSKCMKGHRKADQRCSGRCLRWYYVVEGPRQPDGRRKRQWSGGYATKKAAQVAERQEQGRRDEGIILDSERVTVAGFTGRHLDYLATLGRDECTLQRYRELLELHVLPSLGAMQLKAVQPAHLAELYGRLLHEGRRDGRPGGLAPRTVGHVHRAVHRMFKQAVRWQLVARNPAADLELPSVPGRRWSPSTATRPAACSSPPRRGR
jgi:integrase